MNIRSITIKISKKIYMKYALTKNAQPHDNDNDNDSSLLIFSHNPTATNSSALPSSNKI